MTFSSFKASLKIFLNSEDNQIIFRKDLGNKRIVISSNKKENKPSIQSNDLATESLTGGGRCFTTH